MIRFEDKKPEALSNTRPDTGSKSNKEAPSKFDKVAYQRDYMRKRRAAKKAKAS